MKTITKTPAVPHFQVQDDPRWISIATRDPNAHERFYYSVESTGIYCRPTCPSRLPRPENVRFHATCEAAERAGFRPCKRCRPRDADVSHRYALMVSHACRIMEAAGEPVSVQVLAERIGLSAWHFHRLFKRFTGLTPRAYAAGLRGSRVRQALHPAATVIEAVFESGYHSSSRFYEASPDLIGMTPGDYRKGGADMEIHFAVGECALGSILVAQSRRGICAISLGDRAETLLEELQSRFPNAQLLGGDEGYENMVAKVVSLIQAPHAAVDPGLPLDIRGTIFQQRVWQALRNIPLGKTVTYTEIARLIGAPQAVRAVASACAANTLALAIPCHRVVRIDGSLSGYRWGIERKRALLEMESGAVGGKSKNEGQTDPAA